MKMKLFTMLVISAVLISSFTVSVLPYANALTQRTDFSNRHTTASWGNSRVCGDHICKSGEQTEMQMKLSAAQRGTIEHLKKSGSYGGMHVQGMMPTTSGNLKMSENMTLGENMTDTGKTMPNNK